MIEALGIVFAQFLMPFLLRRETQLILSVIAALCLVPLLLGIVLDSTGPPRTEILVGPFGAEVEGSAALAAALNTQAPIRYLFDSGGDTSVHPHQSNSTVTVNGRPLGPAHSVHDDIRSGGSSSGLYSHWGDTLIFSLPAGVENSSSTVLTVHYAWSIRDRVADAAIVVLAGSLFLLAFCQRLLNPAASSDLALTGTGLFILASKVVWWSALVTAMLYLASIAIGSAAGWYLPNTAIFSYLPWTRRLAEFEPYASHAILSFALTGVVVTWLVPSTSEAISIMRGQEERWIDQFGRYGLILLVALFLFSIGATWAGIPRTQDLSGNAIAGLVPFNDATGHFAETFQSAHQGLWSDFASRRPLAAALRSLGMLLTGYSNFLFLSLQTILLAIAIYAATWSVMRWRGLWAGITFLGLSVILVRPYLPSNLTEPIGILLAMASVPSFVRALVSGSLRAKGTGLFLTSAALSVRMGNLFALPAMALWMLVYSGPNWSQRLRTLAVLAMSLLVVGTLTWSLSETYGSKQGEVGSNFAYVFCGLTHDGNWTTCEGIYAAELAEAGNDESARAKILYAHGMENLIHEPLRLVNRLAYNVASFTESLPVILLRGYTGESPGTLLTMAWLLAAVVGLVRFVGGGGMDRSELIFWGLFCLSLVAAASIIFADDGLRVLSASYPLLFLLVSSGFNSRTVMAPFAEGARSRGPRRCASLGLMACVVGGSCAAPWVAFHWDLVGARALEATAKSEGEDVYLASRYMTGFLVVPDGVESRKNVPTITLTEFHQIIANSHIEQYGKIDAPLPPFGVVAAPGLVPNGGALLFTPEKMFVDRAALGWRVTYSGGTNFRVVDKATAITQLP